MTVQRHVDPNSLLGITVFRWPFTTTGAPAAEIQETFGAYAAEEIEVLQLALDLSALTGGTTPTAKLQFRTFTSTELEENPAKGTTLCEGFANTAVAPSIVTFGYRQFVAPALVSISPTAGIRIVRVGLKLVLTGSPTTVTGVGTAVVRLWSGIDRL